MKRKINRVGQNTLTVSLPSKWVAEQKLKKGDELDITLDNACLIFSKAEQHKEKKEITLNIDSFNYHALGRALDVLYKAHYDKIILTYSKEEIYYEKKEQNINLRSLINKFVNRFIGAEITAQSATKTEIECFITEESPDLDKIEKRIYFLLKEMGDELLTSIGSDYKKFHDISYDHHDNIARFINYFLKVLHNSHKSEEEKKIAFTFYTLIDQIVDKIRHLSEAIHENGCTPKVKKYLNDILEFFFEQFIALHKIQITPELIRKRYHLKKKIHNESFNAKELRVISEVSPCMDTLNIFSEYALIKKLKIKE